MSEVQTLSNAGGDENTVDTQGTTPSEDQKAAEMERVQEEAAVEREEDGGYQ